MKATRILIVAVLAIVMAFVMAQRADAQTVVVRTNLAAWAAQGANIGIDFAANRYYYICLGGVILVLGIVISFVSTYFSLLRYIRMSDSKLY